MMPSKIQTCAALARRVRDRFLAIVAQLVVASVIGFGPSQASAAVYNFSYTFGSGDVVTGSLSGTQNGIFLESVSGVSVSLNGNPLTGGDLYQPWAFVPGCCFALGTPVISFDGNLNNFIFADAAPYNPSQTNYFSFVATDGLWDNVNVYFPSSPYITDVSYNGVAYGGNFAFDASRWSLTLAPVPGPDSLALFGLGVLAIGAVRRKSA
ncbi:MAG: PEP-CTERM sorting domain-containing protein [Rhodobacteraceae bacterium]|nr:PEP-CTERM sorting domain-containing protein [Paracoccaceae bacterium]